MASIWRELMPRLAFGTAAGCIVGLLEAALALSHFAAGGVFFRR